MDTELTTQLTQLWEWLPRPTEEHVVRLFARDASGGMVGDYARTYRELERFVKCFNGKKNIYVSLNPTTCTIGKRHATSDVTHWSFFPVDIDPDTPDAPVAKTTDLVLEYMRSEFSLKDEPIVIDSGRGRQLWYRLKDYPLNHPAIATSFEGAIPAGHARRAMRYWLSRISSAMPEDTACKIDPTVSDLPRVMRCPGTVNLKTGRTATVVNGMTHVFDLLGNQLIAGTPEESLAHEPRGMVSSSKTWKEAYPFLTWACRRYLMEGQSEPGRHTALWLLIKNLHEHGVEKEQAEDAASYANMLRGHDEALPTREVEKIITQVYGGY